MNTSSPKESRSRRDHPIEVPRDRQTENSSAPSRQWTPAAGSINAPDELYAAGGDKPLPPNSPEANALQARPPRAKGELGVGSAGDAARPTKEGFTGKSLPPRGQR